MRPRRHRDRARAPATRPDDIASHADGCSCTRCSGLTACPLCGRQKLDLDWCFHCKRLVFLSGSAARRAFYQAYREARANGRIGYASLRAPRARMAAAQALRDRLSQDETTLARRRINDLRTELVVRANQDWSFA